MYWLPTPRWIPAALCVAIVFAARAANARTPNGINEGAVDRMIDLNRQAYIDIKEQRFQAAQYHLTEALVISETEGLENHPMTAQTYVHLAVVALAGRKDRGEATKDFLLALKIDPNVSITRGLETSALKLLYLEAREKLELPPNPDPTAQPASETPTSAFSTTSAAGPVQGAYGGGSEDSPTTPSPEMDGLPDPDPPARVQMPLYCPLPFELPEGEDFVVRCLTQKLQRKSSAVLYYRAEGDSEDYTSIAMQRSRKGWMVAVIPGAALHGNSMSFYIEAQVPGSPNSIYLGRADSPVLFRIKPQPVQAETGDDPKEAHGRDEHGGHSPDPARPARDRAPGTMWFALGAGTGAVYHGHETVDSNATIPGTSTPVRTQAGFSPASLAQIEPEIGYQLNRRFSISVLGRFQYAPKDSGAFTPAAGQNDVLTTAFAGYARGRLLFAGARGFQTYLAGGVGAGTNFLAVVGQHCGPSSCTLNHSDTLHGGVLGLTLGGGVIYHLTSTFGLFAEAKEILTVPKPMALSEFSLGVTFAYGPRHAAQGNQARATSQVSMR